MRTIFRIGGAILAAITLLAGAHAAAHQPTDGQPTAMRGNDCCY